MTAYFSYIGDLESGDFEWEKPPQSNTASHLPRRLVPADKLRNIGVSVLWAIEQAKAGRYEGRQLDWGAWGLKMTGAQLCDFFGDGHRDAAAIAALMADKLYVLVAGELW